MYQRLSLFKATKLSRAYFTVVILCLLLLMGCSSITMSGTNQGSTAGANTLNSLGAGIQGVQVFVEPEAGDHVITDAIAGAKQSIVLTMYLLSDRNVINVLEEAAQRGVDTRVMLEAHPYGVGSASVIQTLDRLNAAGVKAQSANPSFALTHEKGMVIDATTVYIMTANFTASALGSGNYMKNREYGIIDTDVQEVQEVTAIFDADWKRSSPPMSDPNLVVSPINARNAFTALINSAHNTLLIEAEEMQDNSIEQAIASAGQRGVKVQVILPMPSSSSDSNSSGISTISRAGVQIEEDSYLYMHAKIIVVDGQKAFVGSENISTASLEQNRELGIIVADPNVLSTLQQTFQQDWNDSQRVS